MISIERTVTIATPVERVASYLQDFCNTNEWDPGTVETTRIAGNGGVGTTYRNVSKFGGREVELRYRVDALDEGKRISLRGENATVRAHDEMTFTETADGTRVTYTAEFEFKGVWRFAEPLLRPFVNRLGDNGARGLREHLARL